jgi:Bacterial Ig-like domain (group 2)/Abnormal spindle-like microcephaly-assoc'd, ASPM-SPD-2-Hydin
MTGQSYASHKLAMLLTRAFLISVFFLLAGALTTAQAQTATLSSTSVSFGNVAVDSTSGTRNVRLTNSSTTALTISSIEFSGEFTETNTCGASLTRRASCTISITFEPTALGAQTGSVTITDNSTTGTTQTITLSGTGEAPLTITPASRALGTEPVGSTSAARTFTVRNNTTTAMPLTVTSSNTEFVATGCTTVAASSSCTESVTFTPAATASGAQSGSINFAYNGPGSPLSVTVTGTAETAVTASPTTIAFSTMRNVGTASVPHTVTLTNRSTSAVAIGTIVASPAVYAITANTCAASLGAGANCTVTVVFTPTVTGTTNGTLTIPYTVTAGGTSSQQQLVVSMTGGAAVNNLVSIAITVPDASLPVGESEQLVVTGTYASGATGNLTSIATYTSSNTALASVGTTGLVTGVAVGSPTITASVTETSGTAVTKTATVTVSAAVLTGITLSSTQGTTTPLGPVSLAGGTTLQVYATGTYSNGSTTDITNSATWSSSNTADATVSAGLITGVSAGTPTISAALSGITGSDAVTVTNAITAITLTATRASTTPIAPPTLAAGSTDQVYATATYSNGSTADITSSATWSSSITADATVSGGLITAVSPGTPITIGAALSGVTGSTSLTVTAATLVSIAITPGTTSAAAGNSVQFAATGTYTNGTTQTITSMVSWTSSASGVTMSSTTPGLAMTTDAATGTSVNISASLGSVTATTPAVLSVLSAALLSITVTPATPSIALGTTQQFIATGTYTDGTTPVMTDSVTWSSGSTVATIDSSPGCTTTGCTGLATSAAEGTVTITATSGSISGTAQLTVTAPVLTSITVTLPMASMYQGNSQQATATGTYSNGTTQNLTETATWSVSDGGIIATVSNSAPQGLVTAQAAGAVQIVASVAASGTAAAVSSATTGGGGDVTVIGLNAIAITPADPTIALGDANSANPFGPTNNTLQFTATATYADSTTANVTSLVTWTSGTQTTATIGGTTGLATVLAVGTSTIQATLTTVSDTTTLTVSPAVLESLAVCLGAYPSTNCSTSTAPVGVTLGLNATQQFSAIGTFSDGSTQNLTSLVTWSSGNSQVVTVTSTSGLATVVAATNVAVAITASYQTIAADQNSDTAFITASSTLPEVCTSPTIGMNILVINNAEANSGAGYADFPAIQQILNFVGTPYTVVDVSAAAPTLSNPATCTANYQGVIFAYGGDYYAIPSWQSALISFEQTFNIRQLNWYDVPDPNFGFSSTVVSQIPDTETYTTNFTTAAAPIFFYANLATPLTITNAAVDVATGAPASGGVFTPLLQDASGNVVSATYTYNEQQFLTQTFDSNQYLTHDLVVAYGLLNWVTKGIFLGDYHVYATQQVDDNFINDAEWIPPTPCLTTPGVATDRTAPDASNLPVFRANSNDMAQLVAWQTAKQADPLLSPGVTYETTTNSGKFELTLAMNGVGTTGNGDWTGLVAPIISDSATGAVATFTAQDFSGQVGDTVTISNTVNGGGLLNGSYKITSVTLSAATTPGTNTFTVANTAAAAFATTAELGMIDNSTTPTVSETDSLVSNLQSFQGNFHWISHTYDHPSTLNGLCQTTPGGCANSISPANTTDQGDDIELEILTNNYVASASGGVNLDTLNNPCTGGGSVGYCDTVAQLTFTDFNPENIVTPGVTGLNDPDDPGYLYGYGIRYAVSDTSVATTTDPPNNNGPNPTPNVGIANSYQPLLYEVPRHPNDVFYNVANWADDQAEFDCIYTYYVPPGSPAGTAPAIDSPFNTYNAAQVLDFTSTAFVNNMLMGDMDPEMFHQPDLHFSQNYTNLTNPAASFSSLSAIPAPALTIPASVTNFLAGQTSHVSSLLTDTYDLTFSKYEALYKLPVLTPTLDQLGVLMQNRNSFNLSGVTGTIVGAGTSSATITLTMSSTATVPTAVIPVTGLTSTGSEIYGGQNISHINMTPGQTISFPAP